MKKESKIFIILLGVVILLLGSFLWYKNSSSKGSFYEYKDGRMIEIVDYSKLVSETCEEYFETSFNKDESYCKTKLVFETIKSEKIIKEYFDKMFKYENKFSCNLTHYINRRSLDGYTIFNYGIEKSKGLKNRYYITLIKTYLSDKECSVIKEPEKIKIIGYKNGGFFENKFDNNLKYRDVDGNLYKLYVKKDNSFNLENGMGFYASLSEMLKNNYVEMETLKKAFKQSKIYDDAIMYKKDYIMMLVCNNKNIYMGIDLEYNNRMCK